VKPTRHWNLWAHLRAWIRTGVWARDPDEAQPFGAHDPYLAGLDDRLRRLAGSAGSRVEADAPTVDRGDARVRGPESHAVSLSPKQWRRLARLADVEDTTVEDLVHMIVEQALLSRPLSVGIVDRTFEPTPVTASRTRDSTSEYYLSSLRPVG